MSVVDPGLANSLIVCKFFLFSYHRRTHTFLFSNVYFVSAILIHENHKLLVGRKKCIESKMFSSLLTH